MDDPSNYVTAEDCIKSISLSIVFASSIFMSIILFQCYRYEKNTTVETEDVPPPYN